jgi:hypothetical protein
VNQTYPLTVKPGFKNESFKENWMVFIDYNQDGDFNDENEKVARFITHDNEAYTHNFSISTSAKIGYTTMRVVMLFNGESDGCSVSQGEVEDYIIHIGSTTTGDETTNESSNWVEHMMENTLQIYPNPATNHVIVDYLNNENSGQGVIRVLSLSGAVVLQQEISLLQGMNSMRLATNELRAGNYILHIQTEKGSKSGALTITK